MCDNCWLPEGYPFRAIFLDTNIVRYLATLPGHFFDGGIDEHEAAKLAGLSKRLVTDIDVLGALPDLFRRGVPHALVLTREVVSELPDNARWYGEELLQWSRESGFVGVEVPRTFLPRIAEILDSADRRLYLQAVALGCDAFLTTDYRTIVHRRAHLPRGATRVVTPTEYWEAMRPWAGLFL